MAVTSQIEYIGGLRTKAWHTLSGNELITDAPLTTKAVGKHFHQLIFWQLHLEPAP